MLCKVCSSIFICTYVNYCITMFAYYFQSKKKKKKNKTAKHTQETHEDVRKLKIVHIDEENELERM